MNDEQPNLNELIVDQHFHFSLVMAEVIFSCELGIQSRRIQFISKSDSNIFPQSRLVQLQTLAAGNVVKEVKADSKGAIQKIEIEAIYLLGILDCGCMTEEQFLHNETRLVATGEIAAVDNIVTPAEAPDNVTPIRPA